MRLHEQRGPAVPLNNRTDTKQARSKKKQGWRQERNFRDVKVREQGIRRTVNL